MSTDPIIAALRETLERDPRNGTLWLHLADLLEGSGESDEALAAVLTALEIEASANQAARQLAALLRRSGRLAEALIRTEQRLAEHDDPALRLELARILEARGDAAGAAAQRARVGASHPELLAADTQDATTEPSTPQDTAAAPDAAPEAPVTSEPPASPGDVPREALAPVAGDDDTDDWASEFDWGDLHVTFDDVAGLDDVKRQIRLRIIAPFQNEAIYQAYQREAGGGLLLYGPPGCGKTYIARATAGELGARFVSVSIHEVIDKYWGESEKLIHALFDDARRKGPTVLFFDEFDALGSSRGRGESQFWKAMVNQLLQEMDGVQGKNHDMLLFAATNMPWSIDTAFRRPGRFDRVLFVPPPDEAARLALLTKRCERLPGAERLDLAAIAKRTALFTGADIQHLCERASEIPLERSLESGKVQPVAMADFKAVLGDTQSSALEWFATARNYGRYSNESGQYDALVQYLKQIKQW